MASHLASLGQASVDLGIGPVFTSSEHWRLRLPCIDWMRNDAPDAASAVCECDASCTPSFLLACRRLQLGKDQTCDQCSCFCIATESYNRLSQFQFLLASRSPKDGIPWIPMKVYTFCLCFQCSLRFLMLPSACCGTRDTSLRPFSALCAYRSAPVATSVPLSSFRCAHLPLFAIPTIPRLLHKVI